MEWTVGHHVHVHRLEDCNCIKIEAVTNLSKLTALREINSDQNWTHQNVGIAMRGCTENVSLKACFLTLSFHNVGNLTIMLPNSENYATRLDLLLGYCPVGFRHARN